MDSHLKVIIGTLVYIIDDRAADRAEHKVLMVYRSARADDDHFGKYNGLGGKLERGEDVRSSARREILEEAGIKIPNLSLAGTVVWTGFGRRAEDWLGFVYTARPDTYDVPRTNEEGRLEWVKISRLLQACSDNETEQKAANLPLWEGDRYFLPLVFDSANQPFAAQMSYDGDRLVDWSFSY